MLIYFCKAFGDDFHEMLVEYLTHTMEGKASLVPIMGVIREQKTAQLKTRGKKATAGDAAAQVSEMDVEGGASSDESDANDAGEDGAVSRSLSVQLSRIEATTAAAVAGNPKKVNKKAAVSVPAELTKVSPD